MDPLSYFSFQPVLHDWCNKGRGICSPVCGAVHIKEPLLLIGNSSPCRCGCGFPLWLSEWSITTRRHITLNKNVLSASLNKTFHFLRSSSFGQVVTARRRLTSAPAARVGQAARASTTWRGSRASAATAGWGRSARTSTTARRHRVFAAGPATQTSTVSRARVRQGSVATRARRMLMNVR